MNIKILISSMVLVLVGVGIFLWFSPTRKITTTPTPSVSEASLITEGKKDAYYTISLSYPSSSSTSEIQNYINQTKTEFLNSVPKTEADAKFEGLGGDRIYNLTVTTKITHSSSTTSYVLETYQFTGGAHGGTVISTFTYNRAGKILSLNDVLPSSVTLSTLSASARTYFYNKFSDQDKSEIDTGTEPKQENFNTWYIDGTKIVFVFGQYSIGPYVLGIQEFEVNL